MGAIESKLETLRKANLDLYITDLRGELDHSNSLSRDRENVINALRIARGQKDLVSFEIKLCEFVLSEDNLNTRLEFLTLLKDLAGEEVNSTKSIHEKLVIISKEEFITELIECAKQDLSKKKTI